MAHGQLATGNDRRPVNEPVSLLDFFLPSARSALVITIKEADGYRYLKTNGMADHTTGQFPRRGNPHRIAAREVTYRVPLKPVETGVKRQVGHADFGIAINGIPFDAATAEFWGGGRRGEWNYEAIDGGIDLGLDQNNAHVQPDGTYHYHGLPRGLLDQYPYQTKPVLIGYAADGFPIYSPYGYSDPMDGNSRMKELQPSYRIRQGTRPSGPGGAYDGRFTRDWEYVEGSGDLDACNGRNGVTPEYPQGSYYYVVTARFPFIPRCWVGEADESFQKSPANARGMSAGRSPFRQGPAGGRRPPGPPPQAIEACRAKSDSASCQFYAPHGQISGVCRSLPDGQTACVPIHHRR